MDSGESAGRRAGERSWVWTDIVNNVSSCSYGLSETMIIEVGVQRVIMKVEEQATGEKHS